MKILKTYTRLYVDNLNLALSFYESLLNTKSHIRFKYPEMNIELASIGDFLLLAGSPESLKPFIDTKATLIVDSIEDFKNDLIKKGANIIRDIKEVPTGKNMTLKHPDGTIIEYVQFKAK